MTDTPDRLHGQAGYVLAGGTLRLRSVLDIGNGRLLIDARSAPANTFDVVSPPSRPSLLARLLSGLRRH